MNVIIAFLALLKQPRERPEKFSYVLKGIKVKTTAKFRASRRLRFEDTKRIMSPEVRPKSFGTFEKRAPGQQSLSSHTCHRCCLHLCFTLAQGLLYLRFCPTHPLLRARDGKYKFLHCEESVAGAEVDPWLGYHGYLLPITSFAV